MLQSSDILQTDATIIVGVLILLTIRSFKFPESQKKTFFIFTKEQLVAAIILPFASSAIQILFKYVSYSPTDPDLTSIDVILPIVGFIYIIIMILVIAKLGKVES